MAFSIFSGFPGIGGGGGAGSTQFASVVLSDADIKALATTPIEIVPAVAGSFIIPVAWYVEKPTLAGVYVTNATLQLQYDTSTTSLVTGITPQLATAQNFFGFSVQNGASFNLASLPHKGKSIKVGNTNNTGGNAANTLKVGVWYVVQASVV